MKIIIFILFSLDSIKLKLKYDVKVYDIPRNSEINLWIPLPLENEEQKILKEKIIAPEYEIKREGKYGNRILFIELKNKREVNVKTEFLIVRYESEGFNNNFKDTTIFLKPSKLIPVNDSTFKIAKGAVKDIKNSSKIDITKKLYFYVLDYMEYDKSGNEWGRGDFWYACDSRRGNCTDFHSLFIGLSRSLKIPALFEIGFPIPKDKREGKIPGYHCWAYFYYKGRWIPVDISEADKHPEKKNYYYGKLDPYRVAFTIGRDIELNPPQKGEPLNYFVYPYAEVNGKEFKNVITGIFFEKL